MLTLVLPSLDLTLKDVIAGLVAGIMTASATSGSGWRLQLLLDGSMLLKTAWLWQGSGLNRHRLTPKPASYDTVALRRRQKKKKKRTGKCNSLAEFIEVFFCQQGKTQRLISYQLTFYQFESLNWDDWFWWKFPYDGCRIFMIMPATSSSFTDFQSRHSRSRESEAWKKTSVLKFPLSRCDVTD